MFDNLQDQLQEVFDDLRGKGRLTEGDISAAMRRVRMALLEADVSFKVVKPFITHCTDRCMQADVLEYALVALDLYCYTYPMRNAGRV